LFLEFLPIDWALGHGFVAGGGNKFGELGIGHVRGVHPESVNVHPMSRAFAGH
jgi:hypothetical protein